MKETAQRQDRRDGLGERAAPPALDPLRNALFLDLDGTLLDIQERFYEVSADPELIDLLRAVSRSIGGAIAIVSGRSVGDVESITSGAVPFIAGQHGAECKIGPDQIVASAPVSDEIETARAELKGLIASLALDLRIEDKGASIALHYRHMPEAENLAYAIASNIAGAHRLHVLRGKMVVEILGTNCTKGDAIRSLMQRQPFAGRSPIAVGDDLTDEHAFTAANALGGFSILIGPGRDSAANAILPTPKALRAWLAAALI